MHYRYYPTVAEWAEVPKVETLLEHELDDDLPHDCHNI